MREIDYQQLFILAQFKIILVFCFQNCSDLSTVRKKCSSDREKLLNFEAEGLEFAKFSRSLEPFIQTVKG